MTKDLSKQQALNTDPKLIQKINFTRNLDQPGITTMSHILQEVTKFTFFTRNWRNIVNFF